MKSPSLRTVVALAAATSGLFGNIPDGYTLQWSDEFNYTGAPDPDYWTYDLFAGGNNEYQVYTDKLENARVDGEKLIIEARQIPGGDTPGYESARLNTRGKVLFKYGRVEVRAKLPSETGTWPAIWLLAEDRMHSRAGWPDNGEIDIMEHVGYEEDPLFKSMVGDPDLENIHGTIHTFNRHGSGLGDSIFIEDASSAFHVYAINWTEDSIEWQVDDVTYFTTTRPDFDTWRTPPPEEDRWQWWPFDQRFFIILNVAVGGNWGGSFNSNNYPAHSPHGPDGIDHEGIWPQRMEIDYVRVYGPDKEADAVSVPGSVGTNNLHYGSGVIIEQAINIETAYNMGRIDSGDFAEFIIEAPATGQYPITAWVASGREGNKMSLRIEETGSTLPDIQIPATGRIQNWQSISPGTLELQQGLNTLLMETQTGGFNLATIEVAPATAAEVWAGYPVQPDGWVKTDSWLGNINVNFAPFVLSEKLDNWLYLPENNVTSNGAWLYLYK